MYQDAIEDYSGLIDKINEFDLGCIWRYRLSFSEGNLNSPKVIILGLF